MYRFVNKRKLQIIILEYSEDLLLSESLENPVDFSALVVANFDLTVCANTLDLTLPKLKLYHPQHVISRTMKILPYYIKFNVPNRSRSTCNVEFVVLRLKKRIDKVFDHCYK